MEIRKTLVDKTLTLAPIGRVDTLTSPELEAAVVTENIDELVFDFSEVDYVSSAGLRVLLSALKKMAGKSMKVAHVKPAVLEVFQITGFSSLFTIV